MMRPVKPETAQRCRRSSWRTGPTVAPLMLAVHACQARYNDRTQRCRANEDLLCNRRASCPSLNHSRQFRRVAGLGYRLLSAWSRVRVPPPVSRWRSSSRGRGTYPSSSLIRRIQMNLPEWIGNIAAALPDKIKNNAVVAISRGFGKLIVAGLEIPTAYLEGITQGEGAKQPRASRPVGNEKSSTESPEQRLF